jgi:hypothetical protein
MMTKKQFAMGLVGLMLFIAPNVLSAQDNTLTEQEIRTGWKLLWNGKNLDGWRSLRSESAPTSGWTVANGLLRIQDNNGRGSVGDIVTTRTYKDFILKADFKISEGANSGIKYFVDGRTGLGCEYQILDDVNHPDAKAGKNGNRTLASLYDLIPSDKTVAGYNFDKDGFNTATIIVKGKFVQHYLNGVLVLEYTRDTAEWNGLVAYSKYARTAGFGNAAEGVILLQDHGEEVWFKNIKIKEL